VRPPRQQQALRVCHQTNARRTGKLDAPLNFPVYLLVLFFKERTGGVGAGPHERGIGLAPTEELPYITSNPVITHPSAPFTKEAEAEAGMEKSALPAVVRMTLPVMVQPPSAG